MPARSNRIVFAALITVAALAVLGVTTLYAVCSSTPYSVTSSAPPPIGNWTDTTGAVWTPPGGFPGCATGDSASDTNGSPTTLIINSAIPNPIIGLDLNCSGCSIDIQSGGSLTLAGTGTISSASSIVVEPGGTLTIQSGSLTVNSGGSLDVNGGYVDVQSGASLVLGGASTVRNAGTLNVNGSWSVNNIFTIQSSGNVTLGGATVDGSSRIDNSGTLTQNGASSSISATLNNITGSSLTVNGGTLSLSGGGTADAPLTINSGGTLDFPSNTYVTTANGTVGGGGTLSISGGTLTIGGLTQPSNFTMTAGSLGGAGLLSVSGTWLWSGGTIGATGGMQLAGSGTGTFDASVSDTIINAATLDIYGTVHYTATAHSLYLGSGATMNVYGTFYIEADGSIEAGTPPDTVNVAPNGFLAKTGGGGTSTIFPGFNNSATVLAASGTLLIAGSGTDSGAFFADSGSTLAFSGASTSITGFVNGTGTFAFPSGSTTITGTYACDGMTSITGGSLFMNTPDGGTFDLTLTAGILSLGGDFPLTDAATWSGGTIGGTSTFLVSSGATMVIDAANGNPTLATELDDEGLVNYTAAAVPGNALTLQNGFLLVASGATFNMLTDQPINVSVLILGVKAPPAHRKLKARANALLIVGGSFIENDGTFEKTSGSGTTTIAPDFTNTGTVLAQSGTMNFVSTYTQTAGTTTLGPGNITVANPMLLNGGTLNGAGTITGDVQSSGTVAPGDASTTTGTITISGNYTQSSTGALSIKLASGGNDQLAVGSTATLDGTFQSSLVNAYQPPNGSNFTVLTFGTRTGDFATYVMPSDQYGSIQPTYTPTSLQLVVAPAVTDLTLGMNGPASVNAASPLSYAITIANNGPDTATGTITVVETLPAGVTGASGSGTGWTCGAPSGGTITCTSSTAIASAASLPALTISMTAPSQGANVTSSATVSLASDPTPSNNSASVSTAVVAQANLAIAKSGPAGVISGSNAAYTITVTNNGPSDAANVIVSDPAPANLTFVSNSGACTGSFPCSLGTLPSGQSASITSTYSTSATFSGNVTNTATVSSTTNDPSSADNSASATTNVGAQADLAVTKSGPASAIPGQTVTYTVTVTNNGPSPATNTVVTDPTPAGLAFQSNSGACTTAYPCSLGTLASGQSASITSTYVIPGTFTGASVTNTATASSSINDPNASNDSAGATTTIVQQTDLAINKSGPPTATPGGNVVYTITVSNLGPSSAANVVVSDPTPAGLTFVSNSGACTTAFPCNVGILGPGQTATIASTFSMSATFTSNSVTNTASVSSSANDPNPGNDSSSITTPVSVATDIGITKTGPASVGVGQNVAYTIVVTNHGTLAANNVFVADATPAGTTFVSNSGACTTTFPCALGTIGAGQSATITATYNVPQTYAGSTVTNTASVSTSSPDQNGANDTATAITPVSTARVADLSITKTASVAEAGPGSNVTFRISVFNAGPNIANNVVISDPTPPGFTWISNSGACTTAFPCVVSSLGVNGVATVNATYAVTAQARSTTTNTASVTSSATDPNPNNNSSSVQLRTIPLPACPTQAPQLLTPPANGAVLSPVTFSWSAVPHATSYTLILTAAGASKTFSTSATSLPLNIDGGNYTWSVIAQGAPNCQPTASTSGSFFACITPAAPLASVVGEATTGQTFTVQWNGVDGAGSFELQEAGDASFTFPTSTTIGTTSQTFTKHVTAAAPFYYRVRAVSQCNALVGPFSDTVRIVVIPVGSPNVAGGPSADAPAGSTTPLTFPVVIPGLPGGTTSFIATVDRPWLSVAPTSGFVGPDGITLTITADPTGLPNGTWSGTVIVAYGSTIVTGGRYVPNGGTTTTSVPVSINLVTPVSPGKLTTPSANALIIPSVGHLAGASEWRSDVRVANPSSTPLSLQLTFNAGNSIKTTTINVAAGATTALDDIARNWFGVGSLGDSANGTLTVDPIVAGRSVSINDVSKTTSTVVTSRTYNASTNGTLGQFVPAVPFLQFLSAGGASTLVLQQIAQSQAFHTNLGVVEGAGRQASVVVSTFDANGNKLFDVPLTLAPGEQRQINSFLAQNNVTLTNGHIEVKSAGGDGKVTAYASVVDNLTSDPFLVSGVPLTSAGRFVVPGIADLNNANASWRSDVRIFNGSASPQTATLTFFPLANAAGAVSKDVVVLPGEVKALDGILQSTFGITNAGGTLHVTTAQAAPLVVSARTFDQTSSGTLGQFIAATTTSDAVGSGDRSLQLVQLEDSPRYRTNVGIAEVTGKPVMVEISLTLPDSKVSPKTTVSLGAYDSVQYPILSSFGLGNTYNARVSVRVIDGDGKVTAYGSVIDQKTQAPTYVPAQ